MNSKKIGSLLLAAIMVILILTATSVSAKNEEMCYWEQVSGEGFGDLVNDYAWSYLNHLYARDYCEDNDQWGIGDMAIVKPTQANFSISISKTVSTPFCMPDDVLNYTISYNNTGDENLTGVILSDVIPDNTTYVKHTTDSGTSCTYYPAIRTITCQHEGELYPGEKGNVTFDVRINASVPPRTIIKNCVVADSDQTPLAVSCAFTIVTKVPVVPLLVNKTVCDPETHKWVDELNGSNLSTDATLRFRCEVHNNEPSKLTNTLVWDFLSKNLEYEEDHATVRYPFGLTIRREPYVMPLTIKNETIGTLLIYYFPLLELKQSENITIEYNATVGAEPGFIVGYKGMNIQFAGGYYEENEEWGFGCDCATITEPIWECDTVPVGTIIENYVAETFDRPHQMNHALAR